MSVSKRFIRAIDELKESGIIKSYADFARAVDISSQNLSEIRSGRTDVRTEILYRAIHAFPSLDLETLFGIDKPKPQIAFAGNPETGYNTAEPITTGEFRKLLGQNHLVREYRVTGDSMEPNLRNGDIIFCTDEGFREYHVHVVVTDYGTWIKRVKRESRDYYVLMSDNVVHDTFTIPSSEINEIWFAKAKLSYDLSGNRDDLNSRFAKMDQRFTKLEQMINSQ